MAYNNIGFKEAQAKYQQYSDVVNASTSLNNNELPPLHTQNRFNILSKVDDATDNTPITQFNQSFTYGIRTYGKRTYGKRLHNPSQFKLLLLSLASITYTQIINIREFNQRSISEKYKFILQLINDCATQSIPTN